MHSVTHRFLAKSAVLQLRIQGPEIGVVRLLRWVWMEPLDPNMVFTRGP